MLQNLAAICLLVLCPCAARAQDQDTARAHHQQGMAFYRAHDPEGAIRELMRAVEIDAGYAEAWNDLGVIQRQRGNLKVAIECFRKAIAANAQFANALYNLALALEASGDVKSATEQVRRYRQAYRDWCEDHPDEVLD